MTDTYDNSIAFTDTIIRHVIDVLKTVDRPCFMVYLSDHGETPMSRHWREKTSPDLYSVPFIVWFSPNYRLKYPESVGFIKSLAEKSFSMDEILPIFRVLTHLDDTPKKL